MEALTALFHPRRVAVVGASDRPGSIGRAVFENMLADFSGEVVPVNPRRNRVFDVTCVDDLAAAGSVDLAVIVVPADAAVDTAEAAGELGIDHLVIISAGFEEAGADGAERARRLRAIVDEYDLTVVGPNSLGVMSTESGLNATFAHRMADAGSVSLLSQSGAFITAVLDWAGDQDIGFRHVVSLGNKVDVDEAALLRAWGDDPETDVIIGYLESVQRGRAFMDAAKNVTHETPVVFVKAGQTAAGAQAASSHTGAMAGSDRVVNAAFEQAGVIRARSAVDLFDGASLLSGQPVPGGNGLAIVSNAGGPAVLATDAVGSTSLEVAEFSSATVDQLRELLPSAADPYNPVDILGDADIGRFRETLEVVAADAHVDALLVLSAPLATLDYADLAAEIAETPMQAGVPIVTCLMGGRSQTDPAEEVLDRHAIPNFFDPVRAVETLGLLDTYRRYRDRAVASPVTVDADRSLAQSMLSSQHLTAGMGGLESMALLEAYGVPVAEGELASDPHEAREIAHSLETETVVMKIVSPDVSHKSDIGGVRIGVAASDVASTFEDLVARARRYRPDASILGVYVQERLDLDEAVEVIVGARRDPQFGPVVLFGLGGIFVEILEDVTVRVALIDEETARHMLDSIAAAPLLRGARGRPPVDRDGIVEAILAVGQLMWDESSVDEIEINPLIARPDGVCAVDLRLAIHNT